MLDVKLDREKSNDHFAIVKNFNKVNNVMFDQVIPISTQMQPTILIISPLHPSWVLTLYGACEISHSACRCVRCFCSLDSVK